MSDNQNTRTIAALQKMIAEMQYLVDHPRMQQRNWVAKGRQWLPILHHTIEDLSGKIESNDTKVITSPTDYATVLVQVNSGGGQTYVNIALDDIKEVTVYRGGEPGYLVVRGAHSGFTLKDGRKYLTNANEAQMIVDAMRNANH